MRSGRGTDIGERLLYAWIQALIRFRPLRWFLRPVFELYFWIFRTFFRDRFNAKLARGEQNSLARLEWFELHDPAVFEIATGTKARTAAEIRASSSDASGSEGQTD